MKAKCLTNGSIVSCLISSIGRTLCSLSISPVDGNFGCGTSLAAEPRWMPADRYSAGNVASEGAESAAFAGNRATAGSCFCVTFASHFSRLVFSSQQQVWCHTDSSKSPAVVLRRDQQGRKSSFVLGLVTVA